MTNSTDEWGTELPECRRPECARVASHPSAYHECDDDVKVVSDLKEFQKVWDEFFDNAWERMVDWGMPFPAMVPAMSEVEDEDDLADDFRDWFTNEVIRQMITRSN